MIVKNGRFGKFIACPNYPQCKNTKPLEAKKPATEVKETKDDANGTVVPDMKCESCGADMVLRTGRYGSFYACSRYPECKFTKQKVTELDVPCPRCSSKILARHGKGRVLFYSCEKYPECDFSSWDMPLKETCPDCSEMLFYRKSRKTVICKNPECNYKREEEMEVIE
jgi:DNA topoisomerase-1